MTGVTAAQGFVASGVAAGIRRRALDLAVVRSLEPSVGAAMFTTNRVQAAPLIVSKRHLVAEQPQAIVINSGVANAATGPRGEIDAVETAEEAARLLDLQPEQVLVLSTGLIGAPLPMGKLRTGLQAATSTLSEEGGAMAAEAILTTDTRPKVSSVERDGFVVGGMTKGAGMIHPALATMLAVITTDYSLEPGRAQEMLEPAVAKSFNSISVDGECSTNDAVILLANGTSGAGGQDAAFGEALDEVCSDLARQIAADGEGVSALIEIAVSGAASSGEAEAIASRIATSALVKTAAFGRDPNWGRVLAAAGSATWDDGYARVDLNRLTLRFNDAAVFEEGAPTGIDPEQLDGVLRIDLDLDLGDASASYLSTDLTYDYVRINSQYTT